jgi:ribonuclease-3
MDDLALNRLQERLGVRFKDASFLRRALTHRSAASDNTLDSNERLEFLGDSVVGVVVCEHLFRLFPNYSEGDLAKSKAYIVSEGALADAAQAMGLEEFVVMSSGEAASGGRRRRSILADAFEAVVAAIYLDCGIRQARRVVRNALMGAIREVAADRHRRDYKSSLQEQTQATIRKTPYYRIVGELGHEHDKTFTAQALVGETMIGEGTGKTKKEAEQSAAQDALANLARHLPSDLETARTEAEIGVK